MNGRTLIATLLAVGGIAGCTAIQQQKALAPVVDAAAQRNLQVLPPNITREQLIAIMRTFNAGLGVDCNHCHVQIGEGADRKLDFPSDAKNEKQVARVMLRMTQAINDQYLDEANRFGTEVSCMTCHRGKKIPAIDPPVHSTPAAK